MIPLLIFVGGGLGAVGRWSFGAAFLRLAGPGRPWLATLCINVLGGLLMGLFVGALAARAHGGAGAERLRALVAVGVLGGFTTFSTYSLEVALLIQRRAYLTAFGYAAGSAALATAAVFLGLLVMRRPAA